jgi:hypothetical protein
MADAEGETPTEVRASSSARANRPLSRVVPSDSTSPSAFGPIPRHRHICLGRGGRKRHPIFARIEHDTPMSHTKTHRALPASKDARRKKDAF